MPKKILLIEDQEPIVKMVLARLKANGYQTVSAKDGQEGMVLSY
jgi:DNA-binding response OmpR family regulator